MIPIVNQGNVPFQQTFIKRKVLFVHQVTRYTDGQQSYAWLAFRNAFHEPTAAVTFECIQMNGQQQIIKKSVVIASDYRCSPFRTAALPDPFLLEKETASLTLKVTHVIYQTLELHEDLWRPRLDDDLPSVVTHKKKPLKTQTLGYIHRQRWVLVWALFLVAVMITITMATLQYGLV